MILRGIALVAAIVAVLGSATPAGPAADVRDRKTIAAFNLGG